MRQRVFYLDFIRAMSVVFIVIFHFNCSIGSHGIYSEVYDIPIVFYAYKNGNLGQIGVSLFFIISGAGLMLSNQQEFNIREYAKKRLRAIYPMFYLAYFCVTCYFFLRYASLNPFGVKRSKISFILTILGMDGYLSPIVPNFYILGEWFLGCIILLYILFPLLRKIMLTIQPWVATVGVFIIYILVVNFYYFETYPIQYFVLARICEFFFGMLAVIYISKIKKWHLCVAITIVIIWFIWYIDLAEIHKTVIMGIALYIIFAYIGQHFPEIWQKPFQILSKYSYPAYLLHHVIIEQICSRFENAHFSLFETYFLLLICFISIIFFTWLFIKLYKLIGKHDYKA